MGDLPERLRRLYVQTGMNYVQEAADEIERLRERLRIVAAERDEHARWRQKLADDLHDRETQIIELRRQIAEAEQDARRYRYLRDQQAGEVDDYGTVGIKFRCDFEHYRDLDAAIDAAMGLTRPAEE